MFKPSIGGGEHTTFLCKSCNLYIFMAFCFQMSKHCYYIEHLMISIEHLVARSRVSGVARNENSKMYACLQSGFL
jgi:hypothetical protein